MTDTHEDSESIPFFPDHVWTEAKALFIILGLVFLIGILGTFIPVGLGPPADPMTTPTHIKPEWYFLFLYEFLKYVPKTLGAVLPVVGVIILMFWPFLDRRADSRRSRAVRIAMVIVIMIAVVTLTVMGEVG
ncbi:MAG: hypothetical protein PVI78_05490 [Anaerolineales bacterium]|jgi:quinol-cytochrome oxidoreductase complex cytochrome b subunit